MSKNFKRFKRRENVWALIKALLCGISLGAAAAGVLLYLITHDLVDLPMYFVAIGAAVGLVPTSVVAYLLLCRSDFKVAQRIDERFGLDERVQTMLQYKDADGAMFDLQREDAEEHLSSIPPRKMGVKRLWIYLVAFVLGAGMLVASVLLIPTPEPPPEIPDTPFSITKLQVIAMEELIGYVEVSDMQSPYKENVATSLKALLASLKAATTVKERDEALAIAVDYIYSETDSSSSAVEIIDAISSVRGSAMRELAAAINYYDWKRGSEWDSFAEGMSSLRSEFVHPDAESETADDAKMAQQIRDSLALAGDGIEQGLGRSQTDKDDILYTALLRFAQLSADESGIYGLGALAAASGMGYAEIQKELDETYSSFNIELFRALDILRVNTSVGEYAMTRLSELFGYRLPRFERPQIVGESGSQPGGDGEGGGGGAIGEGTVYGSDELVLDPFTGEYVEYGTLIDRYHKIVLNKLQGDYYTEEEKKAIEKYFQILYGGFGEEE